MMWLDHLPQSYNRHEGALPGAVTSAHLPGGVYAVNGLATALKAIWISIRSGPTPDKDSRSTSAH